MIWSKQTILASGGCGRIYRESTNSPIATGDGMAAAFRAGARLRDMEFMQFHPTVLYVAGSSRSLISEAVRGEGAFLRDKDGDRFMLAEDSRAERATRDIVARAIFRAMNRTQHPNVYLDLRHLNADHVHMRFPGIARACHEFDLDIARDLIPVRPGAHYTIGGVAVDPNGRTSLAGLWAAGEVTSSGLHGANRLASNSLIEGLVFGTRCGAGASEEASRLPDSYHVPPITEKEVRDSGQNLDVEDIMNSLRSLMGRSVGIERTGEELEKARTMVDFWCGYVWRREFSGREGWELSNLLVMARLMIQGALTRTESRGTHFRRDHPLKDDACWKRHVDCPIRQTSAPTIVPSDTGA
jgi:L-aspartate oxidase